MADSSTASSGGVGAGFILFIVFLVLKLTHVIDWSWWRVTAPLWGPVALILGILLVVGIFGLLALAGAALVARFAK